MKRVLFRNILATSAIFALILAVNCGKGGSDEGAKTEPEVASTTSNNGEEVTKGRELYEQNGCIGCHGEKGMGDGPAGQALNPKPRNFHETDSYKQGSGFENIVKTIETGIPGTAMVAYPHIPLGDRELIARYIVSLQE